MYITTTHEALAALLTTVTYHQLASPQTHSAPLYVRFLVKSWIVRASVVTATHTHHLLCAGQNGLRPAPDNLHLGCSYHLYSSHRFLSTWGVLMLETNKKNIKKILLTCSMQSKKKKKKKTGKKIQDHLILVLTVHGLED